MTPTQFNDKLTLITREIVAKYEANVVVISSILAIEPAKATLDQVEEVARELESLKANLRWVYNLENPANPYNELKLDVRHWTRRVEAVLSKTESERKERERLHFFAINVDYQLGNITDEEYLELKSQPFVDEDEE